MTLTKSLFIVVAVAALFIGAAACCWEDGDIPVVPEINKSDF